jgi:hypothetical protein
MKLSVFFSGKYIVFALLQLILALGIDEDSFFVDTV